MKKTSKMIYLIVLLFLKLSCIKYPSNDKVNNSKVINERIEIKSSISLINQTIWVIHQDNHSNFWFGSKENGVFFYDGKIIKNYTMKDGLVSNDIRGIQEDSKGNIYFDTGLGVSKFDGQIFNTLPIVNPDSPTNDWVLQQNDLWFRIGFNKNGVYRFDGESLHYLKFPKSPQEDTFYKINSNTSLQPYGLYTIYKDRKGFMWFGTSSLGFFRYDGKSFNWYYENQLQTTPSGGDFGSRAIFEDKEGMFWINNSHFRYNIMPISNLNFNFKKEKGIGYKNENNQIEYPFFLSITEDDEGNLWMLTYESNIWKYNGKELIKYPIKNGEKEVMLYTIYKDNKGVLWLGTFDNGVYKFNGSSFDKLF